MITAQEATIGVSVIALIISVISLLRTSNFDKRNRRREARNLSLQIESYLVGLEAKRQKNQANWLTLHAAEGSLKSGATEAKNRKMKKLETNIAVCSSQLLTFGSGLESLSGKKMETRLGELEKLHLRVKRIIVEIAESEESRQERVNARRS